MFLFAGAVLLAITYGLVAHGSRETVRVSATQARAGEALPPFTLQAPAAVAAGPASAAPGPGGAAVVLRSYRGQVLAFYQRLTAAQAARFKAASLAGLQQQREAQLQTLLTRSGVALGIMALVSIGLGWLMAGRALRPVRTMSARARGISERNLHERLALDGPNDELKELGDTFDQLLERLEGAFESQRRFVANASHELRTPVTVERTLLEVALADPSASVESLRTTCERVLAAGEQQERLIEALLTLARSQRGIEAREPVDLAAVVGELVRSVPLNGVRVRSVLGEARTAGDPALVERLAANLVDNAVHHNQPGGWVSVWTGVDGGCPTLRVANAGPVISPEEVGALVEPFRRCNGDRTGHTRGLGLGLSIVGAIAAAHGADLRVGARAEGGLDVDVRFQPA